MTYRSCDTCNKFTSYIRHYRGIGYCPDCVIDLDLIRKNCYDCITQDSCDNCMKWILYSHLISYPPS